MKLFFNFIALIPLMLSSLPASGASPPPSEPLSPAYNAFGLDLYLKESSASPQANVFISPVSVALALAMTFNGAAGTTAEAMAAVLNIAGMPVDAVNVDNRKLIGDLGGIGPDIDLFIANSIWLKKQFAFKDLFRKRSRDNFKAEIFPLTTADAINAWVKDHTGGRIEDIVKEISPDDIAYLVNAIYFRGKWETEFDPAKSYTDSFHRAGGGDKKVRMMKRKGFFAYAENDLFQAIRIPYIGSRTGMYIFLPAEGQGLELFRKKLDPDSWTEWAGSLRSREGLIEMPVFKAQYESKLNGSLSAMGMKIAFGRRADFSNMCEVTGGTVYIDEVIHKTFIEVNEEGTEAAAATSVGMKLTSVQRGPEPFRMTVDRPFFFTIVDDQTGIMLFAGSIGDPQ